MIAPDERLALASTLTAVARTFTYPHDGHARACEQRTADLPGCRPLHVAWRQVRGDEATRDLYSRLFLGAAACPLVETAWTGARRMAGPAADLSDIQGFYRAFGFGPGALERAAIDHIVTELEFLAALCIKDVWAEVNAWEAESAITRDAARRFLAAHLGRWAPALGARLLCQPASGVYGAAAAALHQVIDEACAVLDVRPTPLDEQYSHDQDADAMVCPLAATDMTGDVHPLNVLRHGRA